jgi:hypothetical protein
MENEHANETTQTPLTPEEKARRFEEWKEKRLAELKAECVRVVMSQTTWTEDEAVRQLEEHKYNVMTCVRVFMGLPPMKETTKVSDSYTSINQGIYSEIRSLMDEASRKYELKKRREEQIQELQMRRQRIMEEQAGEQQEPSETDDANTED